MKRFFSTFWIVILTCSVGIAATFVWFWFNPKVESYETTDFAGIPTIEYCDLKENPRRYDGKIIRLKTTLYWFQHGYFLADGNCPEAGEEARTAISFFSANSSAIGAALDKFTEPLKPYGPVNIVAVGRFNYQDTLGMTDLMRDRTHLHFEIHTIEFAER